jgi:hypothetical protein
MKYLLPALFGAVWVVLLAQTPQPAPSPQAESKTPAKADPKAPGKASEKAAPGADKKAPEAQAPKPAAPAEPKERRQYRYVYDVNQRPQIDPSESQRRSGTGAGATVEQQQTIRDAYGRPITALESTEKVLSQTNASRTSERVIQRYDPDGRPTTREVVKIERRTLPDGSSVTTETAYEQDLNGRLELRERRTITGRKTPTGATVATVVERPGLSGGMQVVEREDRVETRRSENVTEAVTSRQFVDGNGRLREQERERSVATKTGAVTATETQQWLVGVAGVSGQMDLVNRSVSRITERPDGSQVEETQVYSSLIGGTTPDLNRRSGELTLEQESRRERKVQPGGKVVETTSTRLRTVAEPQRLGRLVVEEQVTTPTADGKSIETRISERDANGRIIPVRREVEEVKN